MYGILLIIAIIIILILIIGIHEKTTNAICLSRKRLEGRTVLVTGGTAGMGLEIAIDLAHRGARVIVACPFEDEGFNAVKKIKKQTENENVIFKVLDLASLDSTRKFANEILETEDRLDILINNAGIGVPCHSTTSDGLRFIMQVNYYGTFLLTLLLLPLLMKTGQPDEPSRIILTSSVMHNVGRINFENFSRLHFWSLSRIQIYANSKLCVSIFGNKLAKRLKDLQVSNVVVNCLDPGAVGTRIFDSAPIIVGIFLRYAFILFFKTPWQGAQTALHVALDKDAGRISGGYFKNCQISKARSLVYCDKTSKMVWEESIRLVQLSNDEVEQCFKSL